MRRPAEVAQLYMHLFYVCNQNVLRLDVSMNNITILQVKESFYHLGNN